MKKVLEVGMRVKLRGFDSMGNCVENKKGVLEHLESHQQCALVRLDLRDINSRETAPVTNSQCIPLVRKQRREWSITFIQCSDGVFRHLASGPHLEDEERVVVREVKVRK
jgi:hypothetical protein